MKSARATQKFTMATAVLAAYFIVSGSPSLAVDILDTKCREFRPSYGINKRQLERPEVPYCATSGFSFFDEFSFNSCRSEMEGYRSKVEDFIKCLGAENDRVVDEFNEAIGDFNRKASR
ncbi:hypothetical protein MRS76_11275 [Rhizobiaceae bacterium n13]|uniref:hypothetical protein n=1 Tax=Ferirhizobium litorale TaxID=2927786 RepID=UPI0024B2D8E2|nr:hypothetical protein [Fererhizobium litorale]MDI7862542.1 hypothetical protein [Fererhizobium litorale]